jgi:hypothetical protein
VYLAVSHAAWSDDAAAAPSPSGVLSHLRAVYAFALTLVGDDADRAAALTETAFLASRDSHWSALGGHRLRERLLARCVSAFAEAHTPPTHRRTVAVSTTDTRSGLIALLFSLPWRQRAAIALVDHLGLSYVEAAAVLGVDVSEFRGLLHRGRDALLRKYRTHAARRTPTTTDRRRVPE